VEGRWAEAVVDSSVVVKWFSKEEGSDRALRVMDQHAEGKTRLWVSDLLYHEVANALRYKADFDEKKLNGAVKELFGLQLNTMPLDPGLVDKASTIAYKGDVSMYDAVPVALAQLRGTICITADEQTQYRKLKPYGYPVSLLSKEPTGNP
jgi:predicted nucleic acid-binding protein